MKDTKNLKSRSASPNHIEVLLHKFQILHMRLTWWWNMFWENHYCTKKKKLKHRKPEHIIIPTDPTTVTMILSLCCLHSRNNISKPVYIYSVNCVCKKIKRWAFFCYIKELLSTYIIIKKFAGLAEIFSHAYATINAHLLDLFKKRSKHA